MSHLEGGAGGRVQVKTVLLAPLVIGIPVAAAAAGTLLTCTGAEAPKVLEPMWKRGSMQAKKNTGVCKHTNSVLD